MQNVPSRRLSHEMKNIFTKGILIMSLLKWAELREEEFEDAARAANGLCIVPVGRYEMHGQHLPVRTDVYQAEAARVFKEDNRYFVEERERKRPYYPEN